MPTLVTRRSPRRGYLTHRPHGEGMGDQGWKGGRYSQTLTAPTPSPASLLGKGDVSENEKAQARYSAGHWDQLIGLCGLQQGLSSGGVWLRHR